MKFNIQNTDKTPVNNKYGKFRQIKTVPYFYGFFYSVGTGKLFYKNANN